ncbi:hypothetical protein KPH14_002510 [Odynerus spinipes]|uniref:P-type domain-containing protein n=1 Tax=Odynerus spinipes TaxID=1348599 RepID=A0AAD9VS92_9HYME|nr:hypothetical protein KPH14_002510 [Odynerus spinipes]
MIIKGSKELKKYTNLVEVPAQVDESPDDSSKAIRIVKINEKEGVETTVEITEETRDIKRNICVRHAAAVIVILLLVLFLFIGLLNDLEERRISESSIEENFERQNEIINDLIDITDNMIEERNYNYDIIITQHEDKLQNISGPLQCNQISPLLRLDCHPEYGASESACIKRGCCWQPIKKRHLSLLVPYCYYPENWRLYKYENYSQQDNSFSGFLKLQKQSPYKNDIPLVKMETTMIDNSILRVKISDPVNQRYEPPWPIRSDFPNYLPEKPKYKFQTDDVKMGFQIDRITDNTTLFNSIGVGGFIFADQFLQISGILPSNNIYGLGEHNTHFKLRTDWQQYVMFNRDQPPIQFANLYGSHPFYFVIEDSGNCHGVLFLNSNPMEVILQPLPAITFRTLGGIFDMYFLLGPTPHDVVRQYSEIVGKPFLPPYWSLGFHLCRYGYKNLSNTIEVWNRTRAAGIPFDTQWNDLDYMYKNNDFTYDNKTFEDLPQFIEELHRLGMHYIPLIDAGVSASEASGSYRPYDEGVQQDIFVKDAMSNKPFLGKVWNTVSTTWPDFTHPKAKDYYLNMMQDLHNNIAYDGAWIDMNEPSNFYDGHKNGCIKNDLNYPEYVPVVVGKVLFAKTLCMDAKHYLGPHYNLHNTYGTSQAIATNYALSNIRKKRPFIISRSTWVGHGAYAGHWSGDVSSSWYDLKMSIPDILSFGLFQIPMIGADICGFNGNATAALCNRWMQLGAFYPFARNHNSDDTTEQDPVAMGDLVIKSSKRAFTIRYWLLPYLYTLFFRAHKYGETVARPLFFEFIDDPATYDIDTQFMWGSALMINPVLYENETNVVAYIPRGLWYDLYTKKSFFSIGRKFVFDAPLDTIPLLIRAGSILPAQKPGATTTESRKNSFELLVALDQFGIAFGELYWDDGDGLDSVEKQEYTWLSFVAMNQTLFGTHIQKGTFDDKMILGRIQITGVNEQVSQVILNNKEIGFKYDASRSCLNINGLLFDMQNLFVLSWKFDKKKP